MHKGLKVCVSIALAVALTGCQWLQGGDKPESCLLSGRRIHAETAARIEIPADGRSGRTCCIRCAITYAEQTGKEVRILAVTDYATGTEVSADRALYVVGSNMNHCTKPHVLVPATRREVLIEIWDRCGTSTIAFSDPGAAEAFRKENGGTLRSFASLVGEAKVLTAPTHRPEQTKGTLHD